MYRDIPKYTLQNLFQKERKWFANFFWEILTPCREFSIDGRDQANSAEGGHDSKLITLNLCAVNLIASFWAGRVGLWTGKKSFAMYKQIPEHFVNTKMFNFMFPNFPWRTRISWQKGVRLQLKKPLNELLFPVISRGD